MIINLNLLTSTTAKIEILGTYIPVNGILYVLLGVALFLLLVYLAITFSILNVRRNNRKESNVAKLKQEINLKRNIEYIEQEIMLAKANGWNED